MDSPLGWTLLHSYCIPVSINGLTTDDENDVRGASDTVGSSGLSFCDNQQINICSIFMYRKRERETTDCMTRNISIIQVSRSDRLFASLRLLYFYIISSLST